MEGVRRFKNFDEYIDYVIAHLEAAKTPTQKAYWQKQVDHVYERLQHFQKRKQT